MSKLTKNRKLVLSKIEPNKVYKLGEAAAPVSYTHLPVQETDRLSDGCGRRLKGY